MQELTKEQIKAANQAWDKAIGRESRGDEAHWAHVIRSIAPHVQYAPAPIHGDVIEAMSKIFWATSVKPDNERMAEAATVLLDAVLPDPTETEEYEAILNSVLSTWNWDKVEGYVPQFKVKQMIRDSVCIFWSNRRARILKPERTIEDRVTIEEGSDSGVSFWVLQDGNKCALVYRSLYGIDADRAFANSIRDALIAQLKREQEPKQ